MNKSFFDFNFLEIKKTVRILLICFIAAGSYPIPASGSQTKPEDCVVCGRVCCCPEICAPIIKERQNKKNQNVSCCSMENMEIADTKERSQTLMMCGLSSKDPVSALAAQDRLIVFRPVSFFVGIAHSNASHSTHLRIDAPVLLLCPQSGEVLTPPPKHLS
jgi:hypothetical protein